MRPTGSGRSVSSTNGHGPVAHETVPLDPGGRHMAQRHTLRSLKPERTHLRTLRGDSLRERLIAIGFERSKQFRWDQAAREHIEVYEEAAAEARRR